MLLMKSLIAAFGEWRGRGSSEKRAAQGVSIAKLHTVTS
jgi:hypothetical protein